MSTHTILVAGLGNIFFGDDGFGVEVAQELGRERLAPNVRVVDIGIRGIDLTFTLMEGWETAILIDAAVRGHTPGTLSILDLDHEERLASPMALDGHSLPPDRVIRAVRRGGASIGKIRLVACEPDRLTSEENEPTLGLSAVVRRAVPTAVTLVKELIARDNGVARA